MADGIVRARRGGAAAAAAAPDAADQRDAEHHGARRLRGRGYAAELLISTALASLLPAGSVSYLYYADRLNQLPLGVVGIAIGTAILPPLSRQVRSGDGDAAVATQNRGVELALLLTLPAAAALIVLAQPILAVLFQRGAFGPREATATAAALAAYAAGLPAFVPGQGFRAGIFRAPQYGNAGEGRRRRDGRQPRVHYRPDAVPGACRRRDRADAVRLVAGAIAAVPAAAPRSLPARRAGAAHDPARRRGHGRMTIVLAGSSRC